MEQNTKDNGSMINSMDMVSKSGQMDLRIKDSFKTVLSMEKVILYIKNKGNIYGQQVNILMEIGFITN